MKSYIDTLFEHLKKSDNSLFSKSHKKNYSKDIKNLKKLEKEVKRADKELKELKMVIKERYKFIKFMKKKNEKRIGKS